MAAGTLLVPVAAALDHPGMQALAVVMMLLSTVALSASLKELKEDSAPGRHAPSASGALRPQER